MADKFQITEISADFSHAGTKATADFADVAERLGFKKIPVRMVTTRPGTLAKIERQIGFRKEWAKVFEAVTPGALVLLQEPFHYQQLTRESILRRMKAEKNVRFISVVHDIEALRKFRDSSYYKKEFRTMLDLADVMIVHNHAMYDYMRTFDVPSEKLIVLQIFDYLQRDRVDVPLPDFARSITIAGNLDPVKCGYIGELDRLTGLNINLYGPNFKPFVNDRTAAKGEMEKKEGTIQDNEILRINYKGVLPPDKIPHALTEGFGLVWDGNTVKTCGGDAGNYLRYNSPHKLSLYLSSGLPVVLWREAAEAAFIEEHKAGITVDSLLDLKGKLDRISEADYLEMAGNAAKIGRKMRRGGYAEEALQSAMHSLV